MARRSSTLGRRKAWDVLRLTLPWARKGGMLRNRLVLSLNVVQKGIKKLGRRSTRGGGALIYGDRELSFDETPLTRVKMCRHSSSMRFNMPNIPCIKPNVDFDYEFEFDADGRGEEEACEYGVNYENEEEEEEEDDDEGIDLKAEQFIAKFYEQMKLQRQISYLQYNEKGSSV